MLLLLSKVGFKEITNNVKKLERGKSDLTTKLVFSGA
jgi:hypothetical protein